MNEPAALQVFCSIDSEPRALDLAADVVQERLAACAQVLGPIRSSYRWGDKIESATEWLVLMKTTEDRFDALQRHVAARHPYDVPEVVAVPIVAGLSAYLEWIRASTRP